MLIDLGTNGEIVLGNKDGILCTSTAAGPAFEGMNISCGMRATYGAISSFESIEGQYKYSVIGDTKPIGICGSGLVDIIYYLIKEGIINNEGTLKSEYNGIFNITEKIYITQKDVREFQLAKSAIQTGVEILMEEMGILADNITNIFLSGGLGHYVNIEKLQKLGLLKMFSKNQIRKESNTALLGCKQFLFNSNKNYMNDIIGKTKIIDLNAHPSFIDKYCENMRVE